jgi:methyl-accepting chemotaxis protein
VSRKLMQMPLTRAYMITVVVSVMPAAVWAGWFAIELWQSSGDAAKFMSSAAATADGDKLAAGAHTTFNGPPSVWIWLVGVMVTFLFAGALLRILLGNRTVATVDDMVIDMRAAATGDLSIEPLVTMGNEYGALQTEFSRLVHNFRSTISRIDRAARDLREASREMSHTSDESGHAIGEVAQAIGAISEGAAHQVDLVMRSAAHIDSIEKAVSDADEHASEVQRQSADAGRLADEGVSRAADVESSMLVTREAAYETAEIVRELGHRSSDIDLIVQSIADIATQTNMLALNASIEAARAGESGRGFANVAEEVRVLAEDAQRAVAEIGSVIGEITQQTADSVAAMEDGIARVEDSEDTLARNRQTFTDISVAIHDLSDRSAEIGELTANIVAAAARARKHVGEVASLAQESSATTEQVSASTEETSAAAEEVSASAQHVADTAALLAELSGRFTLPDQQS